MFSLDSRTENFLRQMGVKFEYTNDILFNMLLAGWREKNIGRPVAVRDEAVEEYATLMNSGSAAPAVVLHRSPNGLDVLDGVQRLIAAELHGTTRINAYVVQCDSEDTLTAIRILANARLQGRAEPVEWTRRQAVKVLVVGRGMSETEVAQLGGWRLADVDRIAAAIRWSETLISIGCPEGLPDSLCSVIAKYADPVLVRKCSQPVAKFIRTIRLAKLSADDAEPYVEEFFSEVPSSKAFETYGRRLEDIESDPEIQVRVKGRKTNSISNETKLGRALRTANTVMLEILDKGESVTYPDEFFRILKQLHETMHEITPLRKKAATARVPADMWSKQL
jgi:hypothetical protein